jgi:M6 family metalloprotease-like protein
MRIIAFYGVLAMLCSHSAYAQVQGPNQEVAPDYVRERLSDYVFGGGYLRTVKAVRFNREALKNKSISFLMAKNNGGLEVSGTRAIPVLTAMYRNTLGPPYPVANLQKELFGSWPTGTMTDYYKEVSYGALTVTGKVMPWVRLSSDDTYYEGPDIGPNKPCFGLCLLGKSGELVRQMVALNDVTVDFTQFDNDGPDGKPNSGDDNGVVDFVAIVQPERGGECSDGNRNIWSHRYSLTFSLGAVFTTNDVGRSGQKIVVDDYVFVPALACDNQTMIQIGVFAHEFGHAFGLPDLYDVNGEENGNSSGIGNWGLMGGGSWGGSGGKPARPAHMSAWEKAYLGWAQPVEILSDTFAIPLASIETSRAVIRLPIVPGEYYLVENRTKTGFDDSLTGPGLLVWRINETIINSMSELNRVNSNPTRMGVKLMEADGLNQLATPRRIGDAGDPFRGTANQSKFDVTTTPTNGGRAAICNIGPTGTSNVLDVITSRNRC